MASGVKETVKFRRKREGRTNYKKRLVYLKSEQPRLVVRKTNKQVILQLVNYHPDGDKVVVTVTSNMLSEFGWKYSYNSIPACYLAGFLVAKKAKAVGIKNAVVDFGLHTNASGSRMYAVLKGANEAGLEIPCDESVYPSDERINGSHIAAHFKDAEDASLYSKYKSEKLDPAKMSNDIEAVKKKLM